MYTWIVVTIVLIGVIASAYYYYHTQTKDSSSYVSSNGVSSEHRSSPSEPMYETSPILEEGDGYVHVAYNDDDHTGYVLHPPNWAKKCDVLIVAGGGSGGSINDDEGNTGGGGGGGEVVFLLSKDVDEDMHIAVGRGGQIEENGRNSSFQHWEAIGGGKGGGTHGVLGGIGGSGGGSKMGSGQMGGSSISEIGMGRDGGISVQHAGGGGGGASESGKLNQRAPGGAKNHSGGDGGEGFKPNYFGNYNDVYGSGGGAGDRGQRTNSKNGIGGTNGGDGGTFRKKGKDAVSHKGGGGGGAGAEAENLGGKGGSGIVLVKLKSDDEEIIKTLAFHYGEYDNSYEEENVVEAVKKGRFFAGPSLVKLGN